MTKQSPRHVNGRARVILGMVLLSNAQKFYFHARQLKFPYLFLMVFSNPMKKVLSLLKFPVILTLRSCRPARYEFAIRNGILSRICNSPGNCKLPQYRLRIANP